MVQGPGWTELDPTGHPGSAQLPAASPSSVPPANPPAPPPSVRLQHRHRGPVGRQLGGQGGPLWPRGGGRSRRGLQRRQRQRLSGGCSGGGGGGGGSWSPVGVAARETRCVLRQRPRCQGQQSWDSCKGAAWVRGGGGGGGRPLGGGRGRVGVRLQVCMPCVLCALGWSARREFCGGVLGAERGAGHPPVSHLRARAGASTPRLPRPAQRPSSAPIPAVYPSPDCFPPGWGCYGGRRAPPGCECFSVRVCAIE